MRSYKIMDKSPKQERRKLTSRLTRIPIERGSGGSEVTEMSINSPRIPGPYPQRAADCENAIERDFLRETINWTAPYLDLDRVLDAVADEATKAGWSEAELTDAVIRLAKRYRMNPPAQSP